MFVVVTSATNGYDGSMVNGLQALVPWKNCMFVRRFDPRRLLTSLDFKPTKAELGLLNAIMSAGSICAIPVVPYAADILGRRMGILSGCLIMYGTRVSGDFAQD